MKREKNLTMKAATMIIITIIISTVISPSLFISICHAAPLSFNYTNFQQCTDSIRLSGHASCLNSSINLTSSDFYITGQAKYSKPMRLWDASTGDLTNFTTTFTFATDNDNGTWTCDGLAFFIASSNYTTPTVNASDGLFGLVDAKHMFNSTQNPFIAVEFDTYNNPDWDVWNSFSHVGIDVNSIQSVTSKRWRSYANGTTMWAQVTYKARNLCVEFTGLTEDMTDVPRDTLCYRVDLKDYLTEWAVFGFSASTAFRYQSHTIKSWTFSSDLDGSTVTESETQSRSGRNITKKKKNKSLTIGLPLGIIGAIGLLIIGTAISIVSKRRNSNKRRLLEAGYDSAGVLLQNNGKGVAGINGDKLHPINAGARFIPAEEVKEAIELLKNTVLGAGGFGAVYKAELGGETVAVKKIFQQKRGAVEGYMAELTIIAQLRHENLVRLMGWSYDNVNGEFYLVYEYMKNGSLDGHLYKQSELLEWKTRYRIAKDLARVLYFLHERCTECVLHRDIKSSNVLLDSRFNAKLGDFGLARVVERDAGSQTLPGFTHGYLAPECIHNPKTSKVTDTFSFGVVALEIACGRKPDVKISSAAADQRNDEYVHISRWVWDLYGEGNVFEAVDPKLKGKFVKEEMHRLLMVGLHCAHPDPKQRPSMKAAMEVLEFNAPLVDLPLRYPANNYSQTLPRIVEQYSSVSSGPLGSTNRSSSSTY